MNLVTYSLDTNEFQALLNETKDEVIERINVDHGTKINPCEYMFVLQTRGCLGRFWDRLLGNPKEYETRRVLVRVCLPNQSQSHGAAEQTSAEAK